MLNNFEYHSRRIQYVKMDGLKSFFSGCDYSSMLKKCKAVNSACRVETNADTTWLNGRRVWILEMVRNFVMNETPPEERFLLPVG